ncbi:unnamed protein product [Macrosiphum euphorbiae]|uniref:MD-2-related lipid-recognition domain-containing protein n=1 Tax=Macrosiphum euphorbiae TaxID=13131 RepID=A0AAV0XPY6_9HEMI|nr:unnamed protein product [Macrosiphum euphorbiae]
MKCLLINLLVFVIAVNSETTRKPLFLPQLPVGEYKINVLALLRCGVSNERFKFNYYLSKLSINTTEIKGNVTYYEPLDDTYTVEANLAVKDSVGGWKDNAHIFKTPNACSSLKMLAGKHFTSITEKLGMHNVKNCPIPAGCYVTAGVKHDSTFNGNLPKQFFYLTYKFRFQLTKNKVVYGCAISVVEVKRPWEND